jgi:hypothetical protein
VLQVSPISTGEIAREIMRNQKYLRTTALISAPGWKIQSGDTHEWRDSCLEVTLEVESWGMETG